MKIEEAAQCIFDSKLVYVCNEKLTSFIPRGIFLDDTDFKRLFLTDGRLDFKIARDVNDCFATKQEAGMAWINKKYQAIDNFMSENGIELVTPKPKAKEIMYRKGGQNDTSKIEG
jgi:hypothetical protein